jgi:predicted nuclease with TOPRIM domain
MEEQKDNMNKPNLQEQYDKLQERQHWLFDKAAYHYAKYTDAQTEATQLSFTLSALEEKLSKLQEYNLCAQMELFGEDE